MIPAQKLETELEHSATRAFSKSPRVEQIHYLKDYKNIHVPVQKLKTKEKTPSNFQTKKSIFNLWK
jgi:hypothetical protein